MCNFDKIHDRVYGLTVSPLIFAVRNVRVGVDKLQRMDSFVGRLRGLPARLPRVTTLHDQTLSNPLGLNTSKRELAEQNSWRRTYDHEG